MRLLIFACGLLAGWVLAQRAGVAPAPKPEIRYRRAMAFSVN